MINRMRFWIGIFAILMLSVACSKSQSPELLVKMTDSSDCIQNIANGDLTKVKPSSSFHWISSGKMELNRNNVLSSCDKDGLEIKAEIIEGKIKITEKPKNAADSCRCLKNYRIEIEEIPEGDYTLEVNDDVLGLVRIY